MTFRPIIMYLSIFYIIFNFNLFPVLEITVLCSAQDIQQLAVTAGDDVTLPCTSTSDYPQWRGPENLAYNNPGPSSIPNLNVPKQKRD